MSKEFIKSHLQELQSIETRIRDINRVLAILNKYCESQPENDEVYNMSLLLNLLYSNTKEISDDLVKISDRIVAHFLV